MYQTYHIYEPCHHPLHIVILLVETNPKELVAHHSTKRNDNYNHDMLKEINLK